MTALQALWVARMLQGEMVIDSLETAQLLMDTVYNRAHAGWCSGIQDCIESGYWGALVVKEPALYYLNLTKTLGWYERDIFFAFSASDIRRVGVFQHPKYISNGIYFFGPSLNTPSTNHIHQSGGDLGCVIWEGTQWNVCP